MSIFTHHLTHPLWISLNVITLMAEDQDTNLPSHAVIENRWLTMVNEIQQQHNVLIELIEKLEENPVINQIMVFKLTRLQQHVLDTLSRLLVESQEGGEPVAANQFWERLQKKQQHSQVLVLLKQQIDQELINLELSTSATRNIQL